MKARSTGVDTDLQRFYLESCECELQAYKPGNVSVYSHGHGMTVEDFRRSARVSAPHLTDPTLSLGEKIYYAVEATQDAVGCNTNLGIILLCAPLFQAMQGEFAEASLRLRLARVLETASQGDTLWVYRAIRLAKPAGLGTAPDQDVSTTPDVRLIEAMRLASDRDRIAYQYVSRYSDIFNFAITRYHSAFNQWKDENWAAVAVYVGLLKQQADSHVVRKFGHRYTGMVAERMGYLEETLSHSTSTERLLKPFREVDDLFKSFGINPGTTADLTVACLMSVRLANWLQREEGLNGLR